MTIEFDRQHGACESCRWAEWSEYYPETRYEPAEYPEVIGCVQDHKAWDVNPEEGCFDYEWTPGAYDPNDDF